VSVDGHPSVKKVDGNRYETMVYHQLKQGIANTTVFIKDSHCYCALEDDLIDADDWTQNKEQILQQLNMPLLSKATPPMSKSPPSLVICTASIVSTSP
jgi:hypothetical protein